MISLGSVIKFCYDYACDSIKMQNKNKSVYVLFHVVNTARFLCPDQLVVGLPGFHGL